MARACPSPYHKHPAPPYGAGLSRATHRSFINSYGEGLPIAMPHPRGTGPRATVKKRLSSGSLGPKMPPLDDRHRGGQHAATPVGQDRLILTRLRSGDHKLQVGAHPACTPMFAGDRPPHYGEKKRFSFLFRSVRTCMSIAAETPRALRSFRSLIRKLG